MNDLIKPEALANVKLYSKLYNHNEIENNPINQFRPKYEYLKVFTSCQVVSLAGRAWPKGPPSLGRRPAGVTRELARGHGPHGGPAKNITREAARKPRAGPRRLTSYVSLYSLFIW